MNIEQGIEWLVANWDKIPDVHKTNLASDGYRSNNRTGLSKDDEVVILLLSRQKPSVVQSYDFDEERIAVTRDGKVVWGFDSGCSCPSPWEDTEYHQERSWKEFEVNLSSFDEKAVEECIETIDSIRASVEKTA